MFIDNFPGDSGHIGEELFDESAELKRKCMVIEMSVRDGDFDLHEALIHYGVSENDYLLVAGKSEGRKAIRNQVKSQSAILREIRRQKLKDQTTQYPLKAAKRIPRSPTKKIKNKKSEILKKTSAKLTNDNSKNKRKLF